MIVVFRSIDQSCTRVFNTDAFEQPLESWNEFYIERRRLEERENFESDMYTVTFFQTSRTDRLPEFHAVRPRERPNSRQPRTSVRFTDTVGHPTFCVVDVLGHGAYLHKTYGHINWLRDRHNTKYLQTHRLSGSSSKKIYLKERN